jgi:hypothetical protein
MKLSSQANQQQMLSSAVLFSAAWAFCEHFSSSKFLLLDHILSTGGDPLSGGPHNCFPSVFILDPIQDMPSNYVLQGS